MKGARRLAALIRDGSKLRPQCFEDYYIGQGSCALGAALEASGVPRTTVYEWEYKDVASHFGISRSLAEYIAAKNDNGFSREFIADWLDTLEPDDKAWAEEQVRKLLEGTPSEAVNSPAETESK